MKELLLSACRWMARAPEEAWRVGDRSSAWIKGAVFVALIGSLVALLSPGVARELKGAAESRPDVPLERSLWKAWYSDVSDAAACDPARGASDACPASPGSALLWKSTDRREDP